MKKYKARLAAIFALLLASVSLASCSVLGLDKKEPSAESGEHRHEYHLRESFTNGVCNSPGHQLYVCECGEQFESPIPSPHSYVTLTDTTGSYFKHICKHCGEYTITHEQKYLHVIDFENGETLEEATEQDGANCYRVGKDKGTIEIVSDGDNRCLTANFANYYILDKTDTIKNGKDFVVSVDVRYEVYGRNALFSVLCHTGKDFSYNAGLVFVEEDKSLSFVADGDPRYREKVYLTDEGYDNITIKGNIRTGLYDVYLNQVLVRKDIPYVKNNSPKFVCIRYFDVQSKVPYVGYVDNLKMYAADIPEFIIDEDHLVFEEQ